jgi:hemoglobin-like flavoprotein
LAVLFAHDLFKEPPHTFLDHAQGVGHACEMTSDNPIQRSFELAAAHCEDLAPLVYQRLARQHPETQTMFRSQGSDLVKGSMLVFAIEAILDFAGARCGKFRMIECEVSSHDAYGTPRDLFFAFFQIIAETLREMLGADWSPEIEQAWQKLLGDIKGLVAQVQT